MDTMARQCGDVCALAATRWGATIAISRLRGRSTWPRTRWRGWPTTSSAAHASGPTRADSVLDPQCRAWEFDNLYVTDGCFMPTSGGANPTLTIQANAFRVADISDEV